MKIHLPPPGKLKIAPNGPRHHRSLRKRLVVWPFIVNSIFIGGRPGSRAGGAGVAAASRGGGDARGSGRVDAANAIWCCH